MTDETPTASRIVITFDGLDRATPNIEYVNVNPFQIILAAALLAHVGEFHHLESLEERISAMQASARIVLPGSKPS